MTATFDKETLLDLVVNVIPLAIIGFFVFAFVLFDPFAGGDSLGRAIQLLLLLAPFVALAILTYVSGKAIAGDEKRAEVYHQGQATLDGAEPKHHEELDAADEADDDTDAELDDGTDADADEEPAALDGE